MVQRLIDSLKLPEDLRTLSTEDLATVAHELRNDLIDSVSRSGGHFASSLGTTEISVALHRVFDTPHDRLVWDVGHQAYIHKMLTGRLNHMGGIRTKDGISGFLKRSESPFDAFGAGHAGTSISAAVGMRVALDSVDPERYVAAIIGDGSLTAGMAFEALNHAGDLRLKKFVVVLNDNEMSISKNVGALSWLFSRAVTGETSSRARDTFKRLHERGYIPDLLYRAVDRAEEVTQGFFSSPAMLFEAFGFRYIGPVDGHDIPSLIQALENAKRQDIPVVVHCHTVKGKGYEPAEEDPILWHGVVPFDRSKGVFTAPSAPPSATPKKAPSFTGVFAEALTELASKDSSIVGITAAMPSGTGLDKVAKTLPHQVFDVGICEQHAVTYAAGLACEGLKPVVAIYSTFLQRGYDQVVHDVCIQKLPVTFAIDRGGVVGNDGETHQGVFDIAYLRTIPNMTIMSPKDENELRHMLYTAVSLGSPVALRYPRGNGLGVTLDQELKLIPIGRSEVVRSGQDALIIGFGPIISNAIDAATTLAQEHGIECTVINARFAKPLDNELLMRELPKYDLVCTLEDHAIAGGFGSAVLEFVNDNGIQLKSAIKRFGVNDSFVPHGSQSEQHLLNHYDSASIVNHIRSNASKRRKVA
ncbi:MAG: 1-deoxy-D-xylulose-5-phosphate synthase [Pseudomonadota bacterium]|jgi:1-deoxy-D-xylulose-5-phosphate synthase